MGIFLPDGVINVKLEKVGWIEFKMWTNRPNVMMNTAGAPYLNIRFFIVFFFLDGLLDFF